MQIFYGWVVVAALVVIAALSVGLAGPITSLFIPAMHEDLGIPLLYFGLAMSMRQLGFAVMSPLLGRWIDRYGARPLLIVVGILAALIVYALSHISSGWHLVALVGLLGFVGLQGAGAELYGSVVIAKWFQANRGRAMSIAFIGTPLGIFLLSPLTQFWIDSIGWRTTWQIYAIVGGVLFVLTALVIRSPPTNVTPGSHSAPQATQAPSHQWTRRDALGSPTFWKLAVSFGILMFSISTVAMFRVPHFVDQGIDAQWVAIAFSVEAVVSALAAIPIGLLIDRYPIHYLTAGSFAVGGIMLFVTIFTDTLPALFIATTIFGLGVASVVILQNTIWPTYFGSLHIGAIRGISMPVTLSFAVLGAPIAGWVRDSTGSFVPIWWAAIGAMVFAIALILMTPPPQDPAAR